MKQNTKLTFKFYLKKSLKYKWVALLMVFSIAAAATTAMIWPLVFGEFIDTLGQEGSKDVIGKALFNTLLILMLIEAIEFTFWRIAGFTNNYFTAKVLADIANHCFDYIHKHSYRFFSNNFTGALVKKINRMSNSFEVIAEKIIWDIVPLTVRISIIIVVLFYLDVTLGAIMISWTTIFLTVNYFASIFKFKYDFIKSEADSAVTAYLADTITNNANVKLFAAQKFENSNFFKTTHDWYKKTKKAWDIDSIIDLIQTVFMVLLQFLILYFSIKLWQKDILRTADFFIIQAYLLEAFHQLWNFGRIIRDMYARLADAEEMTSILNKSHEIQDKSSDELKIPHGQIEFNNVTFGYNKKRGTINNLSFKIKPSEKIALIGPSGGGKSTIVKLLLRLFDIESGEILIDNQNINQITQNSLREGVTLVPQDPILFHRTLMENIRYGRRDATDQEVYEAARLANCHEFIGKFPKKYDTMVGERGVKLSGGERQRIAIARAILSNSPILVLDEATSSLDSASEHLIQEALEHLMRNKTTLIIAHRLSTIQNVDRIFVVEEGLITEQGSHQELLHKPDSTYKKLWELQVGGYLE